MANTFNVRIKNASSDDVQYQAIQSLAHQAAGHLDVNEHDDYLDTNGMPMAAGIRVFTVFSTFPPAVKFSKLVDISHDFFLIKITDAGIGTFAAAAPGSPQGFSE